MEEREDDGVAIPVWVRASMGISVLFVVIGTQIDCIYIFPICKYFGFIMHRKFCFINV